MANLWACLKLNTAIFDNGRCFRALTDTPVHLILYMTRVEPRKQPRSINLRGENLYWFNRFCFITRKRIEQKEAGDTLVHTFANLKYYVHDVIWFTLRGKIDGDWSPSVGPLFNSHAAPENVVTNRDFLERNPLGAWPWPWYKYTGGTGWSKWEYGWGGSPYTYNQMPILEAGGYARLTLLRRFLDIETLRNQHISLTCRMRGFSYSNNGIHLYTNGTNPINKFATPGESWVWKDLNVSGLVPEDATFCNLEMRCYSPGYGPVKAYFYGWTKIELKS